MTWERGETEESQVGFDKTKVAEYLLLLWKFLRKKITNHT